MAAKTESTVFIPDDRPGLLREIIGILLALLAILLLLALLSSRGNLHWTGRIGDAVADTLFFVFGHSIAYLVPFLIGVCGFNALRGDMQFTLGGASWRRGLGGVLVIVSSCALLALSVPVNTLGYDTRAFQLGGLIGNFLIRSKELNLSAMLGRLGATATFGALTLIGVVLFTEKMVRDLFTLGWRGMLQVFGAGRMLRRPGWFRLPGLVMFAAIGRALMAPFGWLAALRLGERIKGLTDRHGYDSSRQAHVFRGKEIVIDRKRESRRKGRPAELPPAPEPEADDEYYGPRSLEEIESDGRIPVRDGRRSSTVFPQPKAKAPQPLDEPKRKRIAPPPPEPEDEPEPPEYDEDDPPFDPDEDPADWEDQDACEQSEDYEDEYEEEAEAEDEDAEDAAPDPRRAAPFSRDPRRPSVVMEGPSASEELARAAESAVKPDKDGARKKRFNDPEQQEMNLWPKEYVLPGMNLLADPPQTMWEMSDEEKERLSRKIEQTLAQFKIEVEVIEVVQGPVITRFAMRVAPGVRVNRILQLESELAMALKASHVRILAPIPGQSAVGIEVPNKKPNPVMLKDLLSSEAFRNHKSPLAFALGKNIAGEPVICDLAQMPHLLIAGATGAGKSVCLNAIIASMLYKNKPDRVKFVMVDPKRVELSIYQAIPHLIAPVVSETKKAAAALAWCVEQMENRYKLLAEIGVRNLDSYNQLLVDKVPSKKIMGRGDLKFLPHIVIIIDELADLMMVAKNEVEEYIIRLAQMARAVGMHLVLATQRPSVNVITGIIKANFPSRIAFAVSSKVDSRTILDSNGAETLMGRGDMLYSPGGAKPFRIQGAFVADSEVERLADYIRAQEKARYEKEDFEVRPTPAERAKAQLKEEDDDEGMTLAGAGGGRRGGLFMDGMAAEGRAGMAPLTPADMELLSDEDLYDMALKLVLESRKASVSYIQRRMKIGYARAGRIMDLMEERGIVGPYQGSKPRDLIVDPDEYLAGAHNAAEADEEEEE